MKKIILYTLMTLAFTTNLHAFDKTGKTGVGVTGGKVMITGDKSFEKAADGLWAYGGYIRHHFGPNFGMNVAFTRMDYDRICPCTRSNVVDLMGFYRFDGADDLTPVAGLGAGVVDNGKKQNLHLGIRARLGVEKAFSEKIALGLNVDYQTITKMPGAKNAPYPGDIGAVVPKLELTYYFGE